MRYTGIAECSSQSIFYKHFFCYVFYFHKFLVEDPDGSTVLIAAVKDKNMAMLDLLLQAPGIDVNLKGSCF